MSSVTLCHTQDTTVTKICMLPEKIKVIPFQFVSTFIQHIKYRVAVIVRGFEKQALTLECLSSLEI